MNYSGKIDANEHTGGLGANFGGFSHVEAVHGANAPDDAIVVSDAQLLFNADFKRSGVDLVLSGDGREVILHDYFKGQTRAPIASPDGAHLTGDIVTALAGEVQVAQADGSTSAHAVIGHVTKLVGSATAIRNGVSIILNNGDNVEKGDVVTSGSNSTLGITFIDGTVFGLSSNARMVLNEMVYDPNGSNNSSLLSLVAGTITFVAGETAKHGDMKVDTPVATMGIRGTAVLVEIDFTVPGQGIPDAKFQVLAEPDGTTGSYILFDKTTLTPLAVVDHAGLQINISNGIMSQTLAPLSPEIQQLINDVFSLKFTDNSNTKSLQNFTDTITPQVLAPIKLASGDAATPVVLFTTTPASNSPIFPSINPPFFPIPHIGQPPSVVVSGNATLTAHGGTSQSTGVDSVSGTIRFADTNAGDQPTASTNFVSLKLLDAQHNDITATLTSQQIAAVAAQLVVTPSPGNNNNGSATWTYGVADTAFNFLTAGETLTLAYDAVVDNNFPALDQVTTAAFTITVNASSSVEWIHPTGGLWSVGSNWSSGTVPTATDDAIIPAQNIAGGSGLYDVIIETPAVARNLTLNADDTTGGQVTNDSTLTIGEVLTIFNNGVLDNLATVNIGQTIELLDESLLQNSGLIRLGQGGDFEGASSVTNSGTIEIAGGTLNVQVDITNSGGVINVDDGAMLTLSGATIDGGTINDGTVIGTSSPAFGIIDVTGLSSISNASLNDGGVIVANGVTLRLDNDTVNGTTFTDTASGATIQIEDGTILTLTGASINGGTINDGTASGIADLAFGSIDVTGPTKISNASLNNGGVTVASGAVVTLDDDTVNGTIFTDTASGATIQIDDGTVLTLTGATINGGAIDDGTASGTGESVVFGGIVVAGPSTISNAFLNNGGVTIASSVTLTLSNDTVTGTTFTDAASSAGDSLVQDSSAISGTFAGTIDISGAVTFQSGVMVNGGAMSVARGATLDIENPVTGIGATLNDVDVMNSGTIQVDAAGPGTRTISLVLDGGTTVTGGTLLIHVNFPINGIEGAVEIGTGGATFNNVTVEDNNVLTIDQGVTLTVDDNTVFNNGNLAVGMLGVLDVEQGPAALFEGTPDATLDGVAVANGGNIEVGMADTSAPILLLEGGTTVNNGGITIGFAGTLEVGTGGAMLDGVAVDNNNLLNVDDGITLMMTDNTVVSNGDLTVGMLGVLDVEQGQGELLEDTPAATLDGGVVANGGNIEVGTAITGDALLLLDGGTAIDNGALTVGLAGTLEIGEGGATLNDVTVVNGNVIEVLAGNVLDLAFGTTIVDFDATVTVDGGATLDLNGAVIAGGTLSGDGTIATMSGLNTFDEVAIASATTVDVTDSTVLDLTGLITNNGVIALNASGDATELEISGDALVEGSGQVVLTDNAQNAIVSDGAAATLTNANTIVGAGTIGDTLLTLVNDGNIDATGVNALIIDTGVDTTTSAGPEGSHWLVGSLEVTNDSTGVLEASPGHALQIDDNVLNNGLIQAGDPSGTSTAIVNVAGNVSGTGSIDIFDNAQVEVGGSVSAGQTVTFEVANGSAGLILDDPHDFQGLVQGLVEASSEATENHIDLKGFAYTSETQVVSASFDSAADTTAVTITNGSADNITIDLAGNYHNGDIEFASDGASGTLFSDPGANSGALTINSNTTLDIAASGTTMVSFANGSGTTGELVLENSTAFTGSVAGFAGNGTISHSDLIDLADLNFASVATNKTTFTENGNDAGILTLYNGSGQVLDSLMFDGHFQLANFTLENDGSGHTLILDPPLSSGTPSFGKGVETANANSGAAANGTGMALNSDVMDDPGPSLANITTALKPVWSGSATSDNFAFNFAGGARATMADFHPSLDMSQFGNSHPASLQTALNSVHDEYAHAVMDLNGHDTWSDVHKVLLHANDFHVV